MALKNSKPCRPHSATSKIYGLCLDDNKIVRVWIDGDVVKRLIRIRELQFTNDSHIADIVEMVSNGVLDRAAIKSMVANGVNDRLSVILRLIFHRAIAISILKELLALVACKRTRTIVESIS